MACFVMAQVGSYTDANKNIEIAQNLIEKSVEKYKADLIVFPEMFMNFFPLSMERNTFLQTAQSVSGEFVEGMKKLAIDNKIWIVFGMNETNENSLDDRNYNTIIMLNSNGEIVGKYRKTHLYDAFSYKESDNIIAGDNLFDPIDTPFGKIGLFVCYEVRFPEVARYQALKGADIIIMPTAWFRGDLKSHQFKTLITARAIENTVFVVACNQVGKDCIGESIAVDPMGVAIACGNESEQLIPVNIELDRIQEVRKKLPSCKDRRESLYITNN